MPGGSTEYRRAHRYVTATLKTDEHARVAELAKAEGKPVTAYITGLVRDHIAAKCEPAE